MKSHSTSIMDSVLIKISKMIFLNFIKKKSIFKQTLRQLRNSYPLQILAKEEYILRKQPTKIQDQTLLLFWIPQKECYLVN